MSKYLVRVEGLNFLSQNQVGNDQIRQRIGFFASRFADAETPEEAGEHVRRAIVGELPSNVCVDGSAEEASEVVVEWVKEAKLVDASVVTEGFTFYFA